MDASLLKQAHQLNLRNRVTNGLFPPVILMTDDHRLPDPVAAMTKLPRHSMVVFRHYDHPDRARLAAKLRSQCRRLGHRMLIANDVALALTLGADGVHLPEYRIWQSPSIYRHIPDGLIVTSACHSMTTARKLCLLPASFRPDGLFISPLFATQSHPGGSTMPFDIVQRIARICAHHDISPIGLGGINRKNVGKLRGSALASLAGIGFSEA